jgi:hypothetical protein
MFPIAFPLRLRPWLTDPVQYVIGPYSNPDLHRGCVFHHTEGNYGSCRDCSHRRTILSHDVLSGLNRDEKMNGMAEIELEHLIIVAYSF